MRKSWNGGRGKGEIEQHRENVCFESGKKKERQRQRLKAKHEDRQTTELDR